MVRRRQAQKRNRTSGNFCKPRAQWPGRNLDQSLRFCAPEIFCPPKGVAPRKWGPGPTPPVRGRWPAGPEGVGRATMSTKCSSGAVPGGVLPNPSLLPAKPSEAGSPGRGGARERTQFSPPGGNGVEWTLRRRAAAGKGTRRPGHGPLEHKSHLWRRNWEHFGMARRVVAPYKGAKKNLAAGTAKEHQMENPIPAGERTEKNASARRPVWTVNHRRKE